MSYDIGWATINLQPTPRLGHTEYCSNDELKRKVGAKGGSFEDNWQLDMTWMTHDGPVDWGVVGRVTDMGHASFLEGGVDQRAAKPSPFNDPEQVLEFDAVKEYGLPELDGLTDFYERWHQGMQKGSPNQVMTGGYYRTIISGAIQSFGWDMLLMAAADEDRFARVLESFFRLSRRHFQAWAKTSVRAFICHDDFVWTEGAFLPPAFYRRVIIPHYADLFSILKRAGKKVLFCADGNWTEFIDDMAGTTADGFIFEPSTSLDYLVEKYGASRVLVGSKVDCRTLTFGSREQIKQEIDATLPLAMKCPGFIFAVGNHIPSNVPLLNAEYYFEYLHQNWERRQ